MSNERAASGSWEEIANEIAPAGTRPGGLATGAHRRSTIAAPVKPRVVACPPCNPGSTLDEALAGQLSSCRGYGEHYCISRRSGAFDSGYARIEECVRRTLSGPLKKHLPGVEPRDLLFLDIETTGLSSSEPLFLIGTMALHGEMEPKLEMFLARTPEEEKAVLAAYHERAENKVLVTFNGKSFDWPFIEGRSRRYGLKFKTPPQHLDVLHQARSRWKRMVPNCRLQTLELHLCGRQRQGDIPSSRIPDAYARWLETYAATGRGAHILAPIVHHNAWDILTMADLLCRLADD